MVIKFILFLVVLVLSMLGLAELIHTVKLKIMASNKRGITYSVLLLSDESPESQLMFAAEQQLWHGSFYADYLIAVNTGLSDKNDKACKFIADKYGVTYCTPLDLANEFGEYIPIKTVKE